jgi:hypothetical protein
MLIREAVTGVTMPVLISDVLAREYARGEAVPAVFDSPTAGAVIRPILTTPPRNCCCAEEEIMPLVPGSLQFRNR